MGIHSYESAVGEVFKKKNFIIISAGNVTTLQKEISVETMMSYFIYPSFLLKRKRKSRGFRPNYVDIIFKTAALSKRLGIWMFWWTRLYISLLGGYGVKKVNSPQRGQHIAIVM